MSEESQSEELGESIVVRFARRASSSLSHRRLVQHFLSQVHGIGPHAVDRVLREDVQIVQERLDAFAIEMRKPCVPPRIFFFRISFRG